MPEIVSHDVSDLTKADDFRGSGDWGKLRDIVLDRSFSQGEVRTLSSGKRSGFYLDMKRTMSRPDALNLIADLMLPVIYSDHCHYVGGLEMGAIPVLNAIAMRSHDHPGGGPVPLFWIRKEAKDHGTQRRLEGQDIADLRGRTAVMVDDVTTTGNSVLKAIREARENGVEISRALTIVDRLDGAAGNLEAEGIELIPLFDADDFRKR